MVAGPFPSFPLFLAFCSQTKRYYIIYDIECAFSDAESLSEIRELRSCPKKSVFVPKLREHLIGGSREPRTHDNKHVKGPWEILIIRELDMSHSDFVKQFGIFMNK